jgi:hypothetical protein
MKISPAIRSKRISSPARSVLGRSVVYGFLRRSEPVFVAESK